ncbi:MAG: TAXI family TRAP transporter solute-binding subunit [Spirochaetales bacterium]|nr:TAXI family TRAP transporter solute-binding subunit [Spirochaetales bacterium]
MKRKLFLIILLIAASAFIFAAGGAESNAKYSAIMGSSSLGGTWYPTACRMAGVAMQYGGITVTVQSSGGGTENVRLMRQNQYQMGLVEPNIANYAYRGEQIFRSDGKYDNLSFVMNLYPNVVAAVVMKSGPIMTMYDYNPEKNGGKKYGFAPGSPGSGDEFCWEEIFSVYGANKQNINWKPSSHAERVSSFKDRILEGIGYQTAQPSGSITEAAALTPIRILEIKGREREEIIRQFPWYSPAKVPAGMYNGQDTEVETIALGGYVLANKDLSGDLVYKYLDSVLGKGLKDVQNVATATKEITLENALKGNESFAIPLHPGAERYFKEKGLIN